MDARQLSRDPGSDPEEKDARQHSRTTAVHEDSGRASPRKLGLAFILNDEAGLEDASDALVYPLAALTTDTAPAELIENATGANELDVGSSSLPLSSRSKRVRVVDAASGFPNTSPRTLSSSSPRDAQGVPVAAISDKKRGRMCKAEGCTNYIVFKGLCCRHGGGKKCSVEGCETSAKHGGRCWRHGGSVECKMPECTKKAKARGLCWAHGGGAKCQAPNCSKVAVSNGFCWAHGGGKRCIFDGCQKPAYGRTHSFCIKHFHELQDVNYYEV